MGVIRWLRERREYREEFERRVHERLQHEEPALVDSLTSIFTGLGGRIHQVGRVEAEVEAEMKREKRVGLRRRKSTT